MDLYSQIIAAIAQQNSRPKGIRFSIAAFTRLENAGYITRAGGGPLGLDWFQNLPWFDKDIYAWCDPSFEGIFELSATSQFV